MFNRITKIIITVLLVLGMSAYAEGVLQAGVTMNVPSGFYGTWRVESTLLETNSAANFKKQNVDIWNLSIQNGVIYLSNPFSGASASVTVDDAEGNTIRLTRKGDYDGRILTDTVELTLNGSSFTGENILVLETLSDIDNSVIKTAKATYTLKGEKIAGLSIKENE